MAVKSKYQGRPILFTDGKWRFADGQVAIGHFYKHGHEFIVRDDGQPVYANNGASIDAETRPCPRCGRMPTPEGYDACLGYIEGATSVCCGHGVQEGHIYYAEAE